MSAREIGRCASWECKTMCMHVLSSQQDARSQRKKWKSRFREGEARDRRRPNRLGEPELNAQHAEVESGGSALEMAQHPMGEDLGGDMRVRMMKRSSCYLTG